MFSLSYNDSGAFLSKINMDEWILRRKTPLKFNLNFPDEFLFFPEKSVNTHTHTPLSSCLTPYSSERQYTQFRGNFQEFLSLESGLLPYLLHGIEKVINTGTVFLHDILVFPKIRFDIFNSGHVIDRMKSLFLISHVKKKKKQYN